MAADQDLVQASLLDHNIFADDQAVRRHFFQLREHAADVLILINENDDDRKFSACVDQMTRLDTLASEESGDGVNDACRKNILVAQIVENREVQGPPLP